MKEMKEMKGKEGKEERKNGRMVFTFHALLAACILYPASCIFLCFPVSAEIEMTPINPPIKKWERPLISSPAKTLTGQQGFLAMTHGNDLLIVDADTGVEKRRIPIGLSQYTVTDDGKVYVAEYGKGLIGYDLAKGKGPFPIRWENKELQTVTQKPLYSSAQKLLYVVTESDGLYVFKEEGSDAYTSVLHLPPDRFSGSPLASLVESTHHASLLGVNAKGVLYWIGSESEEVERAASLLREKTFTVGGGGFYPPVYFNQFAYVLGLGRVLTAVNLNGNEEGQTQGTAPTWQYSLPGTATANVVVAAVGGQLYAYVPIDRTLHAFRIDKEGCYEAWQKEFQREISQPVVLYQGEVLVATNDVFALDAKTRAEKWAYNQKIQDVEKREIFRLETEKNRPLTPAELQEIRGQFPRMTAEINAPIQIIGNAIYCSLASGQLFAFSTAYPRLLYWVYEPKASLEISPAVVGDTVLAASTKGIIYAVPMVKRGASSFMGGRGSSQAVERAASSLDIDSQVEASDRTTTFSDENEEINEVSIGGEPIVGFASADNALYIVTQRGRIHKRTLPTLQPASGWDNPISLIDEIRVPPILNGNTLYIASVGKKQIYIVDGKSRRKIGELSIGAPMKSSPSFWNGLMVLGTDNRQIKGIRVNNGYLSEAWSIPVGAPISGGVSEPYRNGRFYVGDEKGELHAIDASGREAWSEHVSSAPIRSTPVWDSSAVYVTYDDGTVGCFTHGGDVRWVVKPLQGTVKPLSPLSYDNKMLLVPFEDGRFYALSKHNGATLWHYQLPDRLQADAVRAGKDIYIVTQSGKLIALSPQLLLDW